MNYKFKINNKYIAILRHIWNIVFTFVIGFAPLDKLQ